MKKSVIKINWVSKQEGGRASLPSGKRYITVSRFQEDLENWRQEAWSMVLEFDIPPIKQGNSGFARAYFLVDEAPIERLKQGCRFELYEGKKKVAIAQVLRSYDYDVSTFNE